VDGGTGGALGWLLVHFGQEEDYALLIYLQIITKGKIRSSFERGKLGQVFI
jgi:hypothetical protein